jgi:predicted RNA-binding Zn-ribbon protein involved in translation (DUF1610 family)
MVPVSAGGAVPAGYAPSASSQSLLDTEIDPDEFFCPVCGVELARSDFDRAEDDYYCPYCSTRQTPSLV